MEVRNQSLTSATKYTGLMTNQNTRDSYIFYRSFYEAIKELPNENQLEIYNAIAEYSLNFKEVELSGLSKTIFILIKPQIEANNKRFIVGQKGAKHGKKGGRPKSIKPQNNPIGDKKNYPKETPNNNVNVNENVLNVNNNEESKSKKENKYLDICDGFIEIMKEKQNKIFTDSNLEGWRKQIRLLIDNDLQNRENPSQDAINAIQAISDNYGKDYFPVIQSGKSFREKFIKVENYIKRNKKTNSENSFDRVLKEIKSEQLKLK
jgi:hypothetical protein